MMNILQAGNKYFDSKDSLNFIKKCYGFFPLKMPWKLDVSADVESQTLAFHRWKGP